MSRPRNRTIVLAVLFVLTLSVGLVFNQRQARVLKGQISGGFDFVSFETICRQYGGEFGVAPGCHDGVSGNGTAADAKGWQNTDKIMAWCHPVYCSVSGQGPPPYLDASSCHPSSFQNQFSYGFDFDGNVSTTGIDAIQDFCTDAGGTWSYIGSGDGVDNAYLNTDGWGYGFSGPGGGGCEGNKCACQYFGDICGPFEGYVPNEWRPGYAFGCQIMADYDGSTTPKFSPTGPGCISYICGNSTVDPTETCDDGNTTAGDGCSETCEIEPACGDGNVDAGEACDDGNAVDTDACLNSCVAAACGDGKKRTDKTEGQSGYEACDDGNTTNGDACSSTCQTEGIDPRCGDGARNQAFEECDNGSNNGLNKACLPNCVKARCGDAQVQTDVEQCDPGDALLVNAAIANLPWLLLTDSNIPELQKSNCLDTCTIAQCSDTKDNDSSHGIDGADIACQAGKWGGGPALPGYNVEACPYCNVNAEFTIPPPSSQGSQGSSGTTGGGMSQSAVQGANFTASLIQVKLTASLLGNALLAQAGGACTFDNDMQTWSCPNDQWCDVESVTDPTTLIGTTVGGTCKACSDGGLWCESCDAVSDGMTVPSDPPFPQGNKCDPGYRCAPAHAFSDGTWQYRCKRLSDDGETCTSYADCFSNYDAYGDLIDPPPTGCYGDKNSIGGRCCPPGDTSCGRSMTGGNSNPPACTMQTPTLGPTGFNPQSGPTNDPTGGYPPTWGPSQPPGCRGCNISSRARSSRIFSSVSSRSSRSNTSRSGTSTSSRSSSSSRSTQHSSAQSPMPVQGRYCCDADQVCRMRPGCPLTVAQCGAVCETFESSRSSGASSVASGKSDGSAASVGSAGSTASNRSGSSANPGSTGSAGSNTSNSAGSVGSATSGRSSSAGVFGSSQSSILVTGGICTGLECNQGGTSFCAGQGAACETTLDFPCLICVGASSMSAGQSTSGRSSASRASDGPILCTGNECAEGASQFCGLQNMTCELLDADPCFRCVAGSSSSQASLEPITCTRRECDEGGSQFCALSGRTCGLLDVDPCFVCIDEILSSQPTIDISSEDSQSSVTPMDCQSDADCSNQNRCIDGLCLNRVQIANLPPYCGNARLDEGEQCDDGSGNSDAPNAICRENCMLARCGDRIPDTPLETCDDGNLLSGDGCSAECRLERAAPETLPAQVIQLPFTPNGEGTRYETQGTNTDGSANVIAGSTRPPNNAGTGPAALIIMISGAAAGFAWMRRKR